MDSLKLMMMVVVLVLLMPAVAFAAGPHASDVAREWAPCVMAGAALALRVRLAIAPRR